MGYQQGNSPTCHHGNNYPTCSSAFSALPTPMEYEVYEEFMDWELGSDMMLDRVVEQPGRFHLDIDEDDLCIRMSHAMDLDDDPMDVDDDSMDWDLL